MNLLFSLAVNPPQSLFSSKSLRNSMSKYFLVNSGENISEKLTFSATLRHDKMLKVDRKSDTKIGVLMLTRFLCINLVFTGLTFGVMNNKRA